MGACITGPCCEVKGCYAIFAGASRLIDRQLETDGSHVRMALQTSAQAAVAGCQIPLQGRTMRVALWHPYASTWTPFMRLRIASARLPPSLSLIPYCRQQSLSGYSSCDATKESGCPAPDHLLPSLWLLLRISLGGSLVFHPNRH